MVRRSSCRVWLISGLLAAALPLVAAPADDIAKLVDAKKYADAEQQLKPLLDQTTVDNAVLKVAVRAFVEQGKYFSATASMDKLLNQDKTNPDLLLQGAQVAEYTGNYPTAASRYVAFQQAAPPAHAERKAALRRLMDVQIQLLNNPIGASDALNDYVDHYGVDADVAWEARKVLAGLRNAGSRDRFYELAGKLIDKAPAEGKTTFAQEFWAGARSGPVALTNGGEYYGLVTEFLLAHKVMVPEYAPEVVAKLVVSSDDNSPSQTTRERRLELGRNYGALWLDTLPPDKWPNGMVNWTISGFLKSTNQAVRQDGLARFQAYDAKVAATNDPALQLNFLRQVVFGVALQAPAVAATPIPANAAILAALNKYVAKVGVAKLEPELKALYAQRASLKEPMAEAEGLKNLTDAIAQIPRHEFMERYYAAKPDASMLEQLALAAPQSELAERFEEILSSIEWARHNQKVDELPKLVQMAVAYYPYDFQRNQIFKEDFAENAALPPAAKSQALTELFASSPKSEALQKLAVETQRYLDANKQPDEAAKIKKLLDGPGATDAANPWTTYPAFITAATAKDQPAYSKLVDEFLATYKPTFLARGAELTPANVMADVVLFQLPVRAQWNEDQRIALLQPLAEKVYVGLLLSDLEKRQRWPDMKTVAANYILKVLTPGAGQRPAEAIARLNVEVINKYFSAADNSRDYKGLADVALAIEKSERVDGDTRLWVAYSTAARLANNVNDWTATASFLKDSIGTLPLDKLTGSADQADRLLDTYRQLLRIDRHPDAELVVKMGQVAKAAGISASRWEWLRYDFATKAPSKMRKAWMDEMATSVPKMEGPARREYTARMFMAANHEGWSAVPTERTKIALTQWLPLEREWLAASFSNTDTFATQWKVLWEHLQGYEQNVVLKNQQAPAEDKALAGDLTLVLTKNLNELRENHLALANQGLLDLAGTKDVGKLLTAIPVVARSLREATDGDVISRTVDALVANGMPELAATYLSYITLSNNALPTEARKVAEIRLASLSKQLGGLTRIPVPPTAPEYDLYLANQAYLLGDPDTAIQRFMPKYQLLQQYWTGLNPDFVVFALNHLRTQGKTTEVVTIIQNILLSEKSMPPEMAAGIALCKADVSKDQKNYNLAIAEYNSLVKNPLLSKTKTGIEAKFHLVDCFLLTNNYDEATKMLDVLKEDPSFAIQARAFCFMAQMTYNQGQLEATVDNLKQVFQRDPNNVEATLLQANVELKQRKFGKVSEGVNFGGVSVQKYLVPGEYLVFTIMDQNLGIARKNQAIPVVVTTSSGDREEVAMRQKEGDITKFSGRIMTALGKAKPNDVLLQLRGDDKISYMIAPAFQKAQGLDYPAKTMTVATDARLRASSGEFLTDEEEKKRENEQEMLLREGQISARELGRDRSTVRPGNPLYVQVEDADRSLGDDKATVPITLSTGTDKVDSFPATETAPYSGIFRAVVPTIKPMPRASASDSAVGSNPNTVIAKTHKPWSSQQDAVKPKWFEVDLQNPSKISAFQAVFGESKRITKVSLLASHVGNDFTEIAQFPEVKRPLAGGVDVYTVFAKPAASVEGVRQALLDGTPVRGAMKSGTFRREGFNNLRGEQNDACVRLHGYFALPAAQRLSLRQATQESVRAYIFIDGQQLGGALKPETTYNLTLGQGVHEYEVLMQIGGQKVVFDLQYVDAEGNWSSLPTDWFSAEKNPALNDIWKPKASMNLMDDKVVAEITSDERYRKFRLMFKDFVGDSVTLNEVHIKDKDGKDLVPLATDPVDNKDKKALAIASGDEITITYSDKVRQDVKPKDMSATLKSSFYDATVSLNKEVIAPDVRRESRFYPVKRVKVGDNLMIRVEDWDRDVTDQPDTLDVTVEATGQQAITLKALEDAPHSGVFLAALHFRDKPGQDTVVLAPGMEVTIRYFDEENTHPGVGVDRVYKVFDAGTEKPEVTYLRAETRQEIVAAANTPAAAPKPGSAGSKLDDRKTVVKQQVIATYPAANEQVARTAINAPLMFLVRAPSDALDELSALEATVVSKSMKAAAAKGLKRADGSAIEPYVMKLRLVPLNQLAEEKGLRDLRFLNLPGTGTERMEMGLFAGLVRMQLGEPTDALSDKVVSAEAAFGTDNRLRRDKAELNTIPTVTVQGNDEVEVAVKSAGGTVTKVVTLYCDGQIHFMDRAFAENKDGFYLGETLYLQVIDFDLDTAATVAAAPAEAAPAPAAAGAAAAAPAKGAGAAPAATTTPAGYNTAKVEVTSSAGQHRIIELQETLPHSGIFTGALTPQYHPKAGAKPAAPAAPAPDGKAPAAPAAPAAAPAADEAGDMGVDFGAEITAVYVDANNASGQPIKREAKSKVFLGSDAEVYTFSKRFKDEEVAVKTAFTIAEAYFELAKEHRKLQKTADANEEIETGKRLLTEAMASYPNTKYASQAEYLLANLAQETDHFDEAIGRYTTILNSWPDSDYAPKAQFKLALCYEKMDPPRWDEACEEYVKITYKYPDNPLVADVIIRLGQYFWRNEKYEVAGDVFKSFPVRFPEHQLASRAMLLAGQSYIKAKMLPKAVEVLDKLTTTYAGDKVICPEAMYWLGDSFRKTNDLKKAYTTLKKLTWDYPDTKWAKMARGLLVGEEFRNMEEM